MICLVSGVVLRMTLLLMNPYETKIQDIMDTNIIKTVTTEDQEEVIELFNKYDLLCLPVVDHAMQRMIMVLDWLPALPPVPVSMGTKLTSSGRAAKASS